jgi:hypothetical protein
MERVRMTQSQKLNDIKKIFESLRNRGAGIYNFGLTAIEVVELIRKYDEIERGTPYEQILTEEIIEELD